MTPWAGFWAMVGGSVGALGTYVLYKAGVLGFGSDLAEAFWGAIIAFCLDAAVSVGVTFVTDPKTAWRPRRSARGAPTAAGTARRSSSRSRCWG